MSIRVTQLGLRYMTAVGVASAFYTGCVGSSPSRPSGAAGKAGAGAGGLAGSAAGGASSTSKAGKSGSGGTGGDENAAGQGSGGESASGGSSGTGGSRGGTGGSGARTGSGGTTSSGGKSGKGGGTNKGGSGGTQENAGASGSDEGGAAGESTGGSGGTAGSHAGSGGSGGSGTCGGLGEACCASDSCGTDLTCLLGASCSCAKDIFGSYILRTDGILLQQTSTTTQTPVLDANTVQPLTGVVSAFDGGTLGAGFGCAVKDDGTLWCWRTAAAGNSSGNLGNGTTDTNGPTFRATQVLTAANTPLTNVKSVDATSTCALTNDGEIYCWGDLTWLVNNGVSLISPYAQPITKDGQTPLSGVQEFSVGLSIACALVQNGSTNEVWCWGYNGAKNLGTGDATNRQYPTKILGLTNPSQVVATYPFNNQGWKGSICALDGGNVLCWGPNDEGEAGIASSTDPVTVPTLVKLQDGVTALAGVTHLYPGNLRVCALHTGNTVWCWGSGYQNYASNIGLTNVVALGQAGGIGVIASTFQMTYLTSDGLYHYSTTVTTPKCGSLQ